MKPTAKKPYALPDRATLDAAYEEYSKHKQAEILAPWNRLVAWCEMHKVKTSYAEYQPAHNADKEDVWHACTTVRRSIATGGLAFGSIKNFFPQGHYYPLPGGDPDIYIEQHIHHPKIPEHYEVLIKMALPWPDEIQPLQTPRKFPALWLAYFSLRARGFSIENPAEPSDIIKFRDIGPLAINILTNIGIIGPEYANYPDGFHLLSTRARRAIEEVVYYHRKKELDPDGANWPSAKHPFTRKCVSDAIKFYSLKKWKIRNGGKKTLDEIRQWVGIELLPPNPTSEIAALKKAWQLTPASARASVLAKIKKVDALAAQKLALIKP